MPNVSIPGAYGPGVDFRPLPTRPGSSAEASSVDGFRRIVLVDPQSGACQMLGDAARATALSDEAPWSDSLLVEEHEQLAAAVTRWVLKDPLVVLWLPDPSTLPAGGRAAFAATTVFVLAPGKPCRLPSSLHGRLLLVSLRAKFVEAVASRAGLDQESALLGDAELHDETLEHLMLALRAELVDGCPSGRTFGQTIGSALAMRTLQLCDRWPVPHMASLHRPSAEMHCVVEHIQTHLAEHNCVQRLAAVARMSQRQFFRLFSQSFGISPHQYILRQRVARAQRLLTETKQPMADIAYAVGFPSQAHFTTMFRKLVGLTPKAFRDARDRWSA